MPITTAMTFKKLAKCCYGVMRSEFVDDHESFSESDIKSAVAFFRISFPFQGVVSFFYLTKFNLFWRKRGTAGGGPCRSNRNFLTQRLSAPRLTPIVCVAFTTE